MNIRISIDTSRLRIDAVREEFERKFITELRTTGLEIETDAKMKLTTDYHVKTGRLRASVHTEYYGHSSHNYSDRLGNRFNGKLSERAKSKFDVIVGTNVIYAQKIERLDSYLFHSFERSKPGLQRRLRAIMNTL